MERLIARLWSRRNMQLRAHAACLLAPFSVNARARMLSRSGRAVAVMMKCGMRQPLSRYLRLFLSASRGAVADAPREPG